MLFMCVICVCYLFVLLSSVFCNRNNIFIWRMMTMVLVYYLGIYIELLKDIGLATPVVSIKL